MPPLNPTLLQRLVAEMQRISPDLDLRPGSMARTLLETYALTAAMSAPTHDFGTGLLDTSQEMEHLERTLAAGLGVSWNEEVVRFGGGQEGEFQVPTVRSAVEQRAVLAIQEAQRAREDQHVFDILDRVAANPPIPPPKPMALPQMEKVALTIRRTFWARLLDDELPY